jgi:hypothetical protein
MPMPRMGVRAHNESVEVLDYSTPFRCMHIGNTSGDWDQEIQTK